MMRLRLKCMFSLAWLALVLVAVASSAEDPEVSSSPSDAGVADAASAASAASRRDELVDAAVALMSEGAFEQAQALLLDGVAEIGESSRLLFLLGDIALREGRTDDALAFAERAIAADADNLNAYLLLSHASPPTWRKANVLTRYLDATRGARDDAITRSRTFASYDLATTLFALGNYSEARRAFDVIARRTHPNMLVARWSAALAALALGDSSSAVADLMTILDADPTHGAAQSLLYALAPETAPKLKVAPLKSPVQNNYAGFRLPSADWQIERLEYAALAPRFWTDFVLTRTPVVIRKGVLAELGWRIESWTPQHIRERVANVTVLAQQALATPGRFGVADVMRSLGLHDVLAMFEDAAAEGTAAAPLYVNVQQRSAAKWPPMLVPLAAEMPLPTALVPEDRITQINAWIGVAPETGPGVHSSLHVDMTDNLYFLARGRKRFVIASPADLERLALIGRVQSVNRAGVVSFDRRLSAQQTPPVVHFAHVHDPRVANATRFEGIEQAVFAEIELDAGEALYLPASWAHHVTTHGNSLAVNLWWQPPTDDELADPASLPAPVSSRPEL